MNLSGLKKLLNRMENVNVRGKKFNIKWVKNVLAVREFVKQYEEYIKPDREFEIYLQEYEKAKGNEKISVKQRFKNTIKKQQEKLKKAAIIFSNKPIEMEEFTLDELPSNIDTKTMMLLYELDLIKENDKNKVENKN